MPSRTDDPPQTRPQITTLPDSVLAHSPAASPPLETADDELPTEESLRAFMSSVRRGGRWEPADEIHALAICGEVTLDFTRAELPPSGVVEIDALAIMGEVKIIVPDGAEIELDGTPILGSIEHQVRKKGMREGIREWVTGERDEDLPTPPPPAEPPYFRVGGLAIMGSIKVTNR